jgi:uncharacterized membrane protein
MEKVRSTVLRQAIAAVAAILILKVAVSVVVEYRRYFPPDFESDFLQGREPYFWSGYHWAFYCHLVSGPASLVLGLLLLNQLLRRASPAWHRRLGRIQGVCILAAVVPSGLYMARYAATGATAAAGLGTLAVATGACVAQGWRSAVVKNFAIHRRWMSRTFVLLCSAVVIRLIGGLATVAEFDAPWLYPASCWASWLVPLSGFELGWVLKERFEISRA